MTARKLDPQHSHRFRQPRQFLDRAIETSWLAAIVLVPLAFGPPAWFTVSDVAKVALMRVLATAIAGMTLADIALILSSERPVLAGSWRNEAKAWLASHPPRWIVLVALAFLALVSVSAILSPFEDVAIGGFEEGRDGRSLISVASAFMVFLAIAFRARSQAKINRIMLAIAAATVAASFYGVLQALGIDPGGVGALTGTRAISSFGNPLFFGAFLVMGLPVTMYVSLDQIQRTNARVGVPVAAVALAIVATGLTLTLARGPWIGASVGTGVFLTASATLLPIPLRRAFMATLIGAFAITLILLSLIRLPSGTWALGSVVDRAGSVPEISASGLSGRLDIWRDSTATSLARPWFDEEHPAPSRVLTQIIGYGPDSFLYVYPLGDTHEPSDSIVLVKSGHNRFIQAWIDLGYLGLLLAGGVLLAPLATGGWTLVRERRRGQATSQSWQRQLLLLALLAAIAARAVEQMAGIPQVSDTLLHWVLLGVLVAVGAPHVLQRSQRRNPVLAIGALAVALVGVALLGGVAWTSAVRPVLADLDAHRAQDAQAQGQNALAFELFLDAVERAPKVRAYRTAAVTALTDARAVAVTAQDQIQLTESSVALLQAGVEANPHDASINALLGIELLILAEISGASPDHAIGTFGRTLILLPNQWQPKRALGAALLRIGRPADAILAFDSALSAAHGTSGAPEVLHLRAQAYLSLEQPAQARDDLLAALELTKNPDVVTLIESMMTLIDE